ELSAATSIDNKTQKIESHYLLANIFWDQNEYVKSYNHCDSAYNLIEPAHVDYHEIKTMLRSSKKIAELYNIINYNDSIIILAQLPEEERNKIIDDHISQLREQEEALNSMNQEPRQNQRFNSYEYNKQATNSMNITSGGGWYFYNPSAISLGYSEFLSRWGNRKLEDNWRRKNKSALMNPDDAGPEGETPQPTEKEKHNRDYYISKLPINEDDQLRLLSKIETAYYDLSAIFKEDISDYDQSIILYNELITRFPSTDYRQLIYFDLHNIFNLKRDTLKANTFLHKIEMEFPNSDYLEMLKKGGGHTSKLEIAKQTYRSAHDLYIDNTEQSCLELNTLFQNNTNSIFIAQIEVLNTFCQARNSTRREFIDSLEFVSKKYPNTEISTNLDAIISVLKGESRIKSGDYINEFESPHSFILLLHDLSINLPKTQKAISEFNQQNYKLDSLEINNLLLNKDLQILKVAGLKNKKEALIYYDLIKTNKITQDLLQSNNITPLLISKNNFATLLKEKMINSYINYFNAIYLLN
ncbi:MAG: hypothetical protein P8L91_00355, partial [Candidatus Marinimicrobia bacterium]|nr:hypothetical protein [Candidatus Neomarinimicrobiota bacterium]